MFNDYLKSPGFRLLAGIIFFLTVITIFNLRLERTMQGDKTELPAPLAKEDSSSQQTAASAPPAGGPIIKHINVVVGQDYWEYTFFAGDQQIAFFKVNNDGIFEHQGTVPDGKVKVIDHQTGTEGEENYRHGLREGDAKMYFADGKVKTEMYYEEDKLLRQKEYHPDGTVDFEVDYQDALDLPGNKETGVGKLYYPNGTIRYEWNFTHGVTPYRKAYDQDGKLKYAAFYNTFGELVREEKIP